MIGPFRVEVCGYYFQIEKKGRGWYWDSSFLFEIYYVFGGGQPNFHRKKVFTYFFPLSNHNKSNHRCVLHTLTLKLMIKSHSALPEDQKTFILLHSRLWISLEITSILDDYANRCVNVFWCFSGKNRNINFVRFPAVMKLEMPIMFKFRDICDHIQLCRQLR